MQRLRLENSRSVKNVFRKLRLTYGQLNRPIEWTTQYLNPFIIE